MHNHRFFKYKFLLHVREDYSSNTYMKSSMGQNDKDKLCVILIKKYISFGENSKNPT